MLGTEIRTLVPEVSQLRLLQLVFPILGLWLHVPTLYLTEDGTALDHSCFFSLTCSGWRLDLIDKCVQFAKLESAGTRLSHSMAGAAPGSRIPGKDLTASDTHFYLDMNSHPFSTLSLGCLILRHFGQKDSHMGTMGLERGEELSWHVLASVR